MRSVGILLAIGITGAIWGGVLAVLGLRSILIIVSGFAIGAILMSYLQDRKEGKK